MIYSYAKRGLDITFSLVLIVLTLPVSIVVAATMAISLKGSPFFVQKRIGHEEQPFRVLKFRTMTNASNEEGALPDSQRLTSLGRLVRSSSLDELPQLVNILAGQMSFVGPRPLLPRYLPHYTQAERARHAVRPGITGLAQVRGRNNLGWAERLRYDQEYVRTMSFRQDARLVWETITAVLKRSGVRVDTSHGVIRDLDIERRND